MVRYSQLSESVRKIVMHHPFGLKFFSLRNTPIRMRILCSLLILSLIITLSTSLISFNLASDKIKDVSLRLSERNANSAVAELDSYLQSIQSWSVRFSQIEELQSLLTLSIYLPDSHRNLSQGISKAFMTLQADASANGPEFEAISLFLTNGYTHTSSSQSSLPFSDYQACLDYFQLHEATEDTYTGPKWRLCTLEDGKTVLVYLRFLYQPIDLTKLGIMVFAISEKWLSTSYTSYATDACIMAMDGVLYSASGNPDRIGSTFDVTRNIRGIISLSSSRNSSSVLYTTEQGENKIASYKQLSTINAFLIVPFDLYEGISASEMNSFLHSTILMGMLCILVTTILSILISRGITHPILSLTDFVRKIEAGETKLRHPANGPDEVAYLGQQLNGMLDQLEFASIQREEELRANQALAMQLNQIQINPHLLYNTLDSVLWVLQQGRTADATELIASLSEFFKISLSKGQDQIPLKNELELIRHYLTIQRLARLIDIRLELDIEPGLEDYSLIKLSIQPLVENAIIHGFSGYRNDGLITIQAREEQDCVCIHVTDNGIGFLPDEISEIQHILSLTVLPKDFHHFGLFNINRRIVQTYGPQYGLQLDSEIGVYSTVTMRLAKSAKKEKVSHV